MLYARLAAYLGAALLLIGGGWYLGGLAPKRALAQLQAQDWQAKAQASQVALMAVQVQLAQAQKTSTNNSAVISGLQDENAKINASWASDRALAARLLNSANRPASSSAMPKAGGGQTTPVAAPNPSDGTASSLLANAAAECQHNADQLGALIAEIQPQL